MIVFPHGFLTTQAEAPSEAFENTYSVDFDGANDRVDISSLASTLQSENTFSVSFWAKASYLNLNPAFIISTGNDANKTFLIYAYDTNDGTHDCRVWYNGASIISTGNNSLTGWNHFCFVSNGATSHTVYINGSSAGTSTTSKTLDSGLDTCDIGGTAEFSQFFEGNIDEVGVWDVALDSDAVTALYNSGSPISLSSDSGDYDNSSSLEGWWRMGDGANYPLIKNQAHFSQTAVDFDGANDYVDCGNDSSLNFDGSSAFSGSAWVYWSSGGSQIFGNQENSGGYAGWSLQIWGSKFRLVLESSLTSYIVKADTANFTTNTWKHVAFTYDGSKTVAGVKIYIDGSEVTSTTTSDLLGSNSITSTANMAIGARAAGAAYFDGTIDDVSVYSTELSSSDITDIYNSGYPKDESERSGLVGYWKMGDGDTYPTLTDNSTNSNDGTMTNMDSGDFVAAKGAGTMINMASDDIVEDTP